MRGKASGGLPLIRLIKCLSVLQGPIGESGGVPENRSA